MMIQVTKTLLNCHEGTGEDKNQKIINESKQYISTIGKRNSEDYICGMS